MRPLQDVPNTKGCWLTQTTHLVTVRWTKRSGPPLFSATLKPLGKGRCQNGTVAKCAMRRQTHLPEEKRARYRGLAKMQFQLFMDAIVWNLKRLVVITPLPNLSGA